MAFSIIWGNCFKLVGHYKCKDKLSKVILQTKSIKERSVLEAWKFGIHIIAVLNQQVELTPSLFNIMDPEWRIQCNSRKSGVYEE